MKQKRKFFLALVLLLAIPILACNPNVLNAWSDLLATAQFIWDSIWAVPEPDVEAIGVLCTQSLLAVLYFQGRFTEDRCFGTVGGNEIKTR